MYFRTKIAAAAVVVPTVIALASSPAAAAGNPRPQGRYKVHLKVVKSNYAPVPVGSGYTAPWVFRHGHLTTSNAYGDKYTYPKFTSPRNGIFKTSLVYRDRAVCGSGFVDKGYLITRTITVTVTKKKAGSVTGFSTKFTYFAKANKKAQSVHCKNQDIRYIGHSVSHP